MSLTFFLEVSFKVWSYVLPWTERDPRVCFGFKSPETHKERNEDQERLRPRFLRDLQRRRQDLTLKDENFYRARQDFPDEASLKDFRKDLEQQLKTKT